MNQCTVIRATALQILCSMCSFRDLQGFRYMMQLLIIKLVCCLGWLSAIAFGQLDLSESISGSVSIPDLVITCLGNLAVFYSSILRGGLYLEMGAKDALTFLTGPIKLKSINGWEDNNTNGFGLTTSGRKDLSDCSVVMLSHETPTPNSSMRQFVEYIANVHNVRSVLLQYSLLQSLRVPLTMDTICNCQCNDCGCIVFWTHVDVTVMLAEHIPGTLKWLSHSLCLLPSIECLKNGCHECNKRLLHMKTDFGEKRLEEGNPQVESTAAAVCGISYSSIFSLEEPASCICIPVPQEGYKIRGNDRWTELLIGSFESKDYETRGVIIRREMSSVSHDLENYMARTGECWAAEQYSIVSLIVPRVTEILINLLLVFWFKVDGFSSSLVARRAIKDYIVDSRVKGFAAHVFIAKAEVRSNAANTNAYQMLSFKGNVWNPRNLSVIVGIVNLACSITWAVLVALEGSSNILYQAPCMAPSEGGSNNCYHTPSMTQGVINKWYHTHSMAPSKGRLLVIFVGIAIAVAMDCVDLYLICLHNARSNIKRCFHSRTMTDEEKQRKTTQERLDCARNPDRKKKAYHRKRKIMIVCTMIVFQLSLIVSSSLVARAVGIKAFGRWVYSGVEGLVWLKWGIGSFPLRSIYPT